MYELMEDIMQLSRKSLEQHRYENNELLNNLSKNNGKI